jgi:glycosyltransferase involved in cell wall biosynthesis
VDEIKRILIVSLQYNESKTGGGGEHVEMLVKYYLEMSYDVTVVSMYVLNSIEQCPPIENDQNAYLCETNHPNLRIVRINPSDGPVEHPYVGNKQQELDRIKEFSDIASRWIHENFTQHDWHVVHLHGHHLIPGYFAYLLSDLPLAIVSTLHSMESVYEIRKIQGGHRELSDEMIKQLQQLEVQCLESADAVIVPGPGVVEDMIHLGRRLGVPEEYFIKLSALSSGVPQEMFETDAHVRLKLANPLPLHVLHLGRIDPSKGIEYAIHALDLLPNELKPELQFNIVGRVSDEAYLAKLKQIASGVDYSIQFLLNVSDEQRNLLYRKTNLFLMPTLQESFGITIIEAAAQGCLPIMADTEGPEYIASAKEGDPLDIPTDFGYISHYAVFAAKTQEIPQNFANNLATAIQYTLEHWQESIERIIRLRQKIRTLFTWEKIAAAHLMVYQDCIKLKSQQ